MTVIGVDPSINSTGICVNEDGKFTYYIITSKCTKKTMAFQSDFITIIPYEKPDVKNDEYAVKEKQKALNIYNIYSILEKIIRRHHPELIQMEGVSYGSVGSAALVDLSGLNFVLRQLFINENVPFNIISPTQNKKFATGNGSADKELMMDAWKRLDVRVRDIKDIKVDDLADAYFLSCYSAN